VCFSMLIFLQFRAGMVGLPAWRGEICGLCLFFGSGRVNAARLSYSSPHTFSKVDLRILLAYTAQGG